MRFSDIYGDSWTPTRNAHVANRLSTRVLSVGLNFVRDRLKLTCQSSRVDGAHWIRTQTLVLPCPRPCLSQPHYLWGPTLPIFTNLPFPSNFSPFGVKSLHIPTSTWSKFYITIIHSSGLTSLFIFEFFELDTKLIQIIL